MARVLNEYGKTRETFLLSIIIFVRAVQSFFVRTRLLYLVLSQPFSFCQLLGYWNDVRHTNLLLKFI